MLSRLIAGSLRARVQPYVQSAALRGITGGDLTSLLRSQFGSAYRRTDLLADLRFYRGAKVMVDRLKSVRHDYRPRGSDVPEWHGVQKAAFRWQVEGTISFPDGSSEVRKITIESRHTRSDDELRNEFDDAQLDQYDIRARGGEVSNVKTIGAWRRPGE